MYFVQRCILKYFLLEIIVKETHKKVNLVKLCKKQAAPWDLSKLAFCLLRHCWKTTSQTQRTLKWGASWQCWQ